MDEPDGYRFSWMWGDENDLAEANPFRWSKWHTPSEMVDDIGKYSDVRPINIKDHSGKGHWAFDSPADAIKILKGEGKQYMWAYGDINALANLDPLRWSAYQGMFQLLSELHHIDHTDKEKAKRPCHVKDDQTGDWRMDTFQGAMDAIREGQIKP